MWTKKYLWIICSGFLGLSCLENPFAPKYEILYETSFEVPADSSGWVGITPAMFVADPAPGCGQQSLYLGAGCLQPAAHRVLNVLAERGSYRLRVYGKKGEVGGHFRLTAQGSNGAADLIDIPIQSAEWRGFEKEIKLEQSRPDTLRLEIYVGGIIFNSLYLDGIKLEWRHAD